MIGSSILDFVIGMVFVYLLLSMLCSAILEWMANIFKWRASALQKQILHLLGADADAKMPSNQDKPLTEKLTAVPESPVEFVQELYRHGLVWGQRKPKGVSSAEKPTYIPSRTFSLALVDLLTPKTTIPPTSPDPKLGTSDPNNSLEQIRTEISKIKNVPLMQALQPLTQSSKTLEELHINIENWFNAAMERTSGWYKRRTQWILVCIAIVVSVGLNVNSVLIAREIWHNPTVRAELVAQAGKNTDNGSSSSFDAASKKSVEEIKTDLDKTNLPFGWNRDRSPLCCGTTTSDLVSRWTVAILGWFISVIALSLGAPFWFDLLGKLVNLRSAGRRPDTKKQDMISQ